MSETTVRIATRDIFDSTSGEFFAKGLPLPEDNENILELKLRNGKLVIPGVEEEVTAVTTRIASQDRANADAGQSGRKPAKTPAKKVAVKNDDAPKGEVIVGGEARQTAPAPTGSAFE